MDDLELRLNPITKLKIYQEARKIVFQKMDNDIVTPERADEILSYVKDNVVNIKTVKELNKFYDLLLKKFDELKLLQKIFDLEVDEKIDKILLLLIDHILNKGDFELADRIFSEIEEIIKKGGEKIKYIKKLKEEMPEDFGEVLKDL